MISKKVSVHVQHSDDASSEVDWTESSVYDTWRWLSVIHDGFGYDVARLKVMKRNQCLAQFPLTTRRKSIFLLGGSPLRGTHTEFGGTINTITTITAAEVMVAVHTHIRKMGCSWIEFIFSQPILDIDKVMGDLGYERKQKHSLQVDLDQSAEMVWSSFSGRARTEIRKAEKYALSVERLLAKHNVDYMHLVNTVFSGQKRQPSFDIKFLDAIHEHLHDDEFAHYGVFMRGQLVAGGLFLFGQDRMVFVSGASDYTSRKLGVNSLIQWKAMQEAIKAGIKLYDMGGTGVSSIDKFKASFGGTPVTYDRYVYSSLFARVPARIYEFAHKQGWAR